MTQAVEETTVTPGRPRDQRIHEAVIAATRELLVVHGYSGLSLTAVATRAGTSTPAIYRRWPTKAHLVHDAAFPRELSSHHLEFSGDLRADLQALVAGAVLLFTEPVVRTALPGLIGDLAPNPELHETLLSWVWGSQIGEVQELLDRAAGLGLAKPGIDAHHVLSLVGGSALLAVVIPSGVELDQAWVAAIADIVLQGIAG